MSEAQNSNSAKCDTSSKPVVALIIGMAGTGKTTLTESLISHLRNKDVNVFSTNLDPAVNEVKYPANIDIRDTVDYKKLRKDHSLGPNGAILTSLNIFATKFDKVMDIMAKRASENKYFLFDTPGQIEMFTWSASGTIIPEALASDYPSVILYVIDTPRNVDVDAYASNMLYACSIYMTYQIPFIVVLNKTDIVDSSQIIGWIRDSESFGDAISDISDLSRKVILTFEKFYKDLKVVSVSSSTGQGLDELVKAIDESRLEYESDYLPYWKNMKKDQSKAVDVDLNGLPSEFARGASIVENQPHYVYPPEYEDDDSDDEKDSEETQ